MQDYLRIVRSQPQLDRGPLDSAVIAGGVKMKLPEIWFCVNRGIAKGALEDRLAYLLIRWRQTPGTTSLALWIRRPPQEQKIRGLNPACDGIFPGRGIPVT